MVCISHTYFNLILNKFLALPKFIKYEKVAYPEEDDGYVYTGVQNEFPIEVEVGRDFEFHSVFVCPITREVISPDHHAALLPCGHVIAEYYYFWKMKCIY